MNKPQRPIKVTDITIAQLKKIETEEDFKAFFSMEGVSCRGICANYKFTKPFRGSYYSNGAKRCQHCSVYVMWDGISCPCCGYKLRTKRRKKSLYYQRMFANIVKEQENASLEKPKAIVANAMV